MFNQLPLVPDAQQGAAADPRARAPVDPRQAIQQIFREHRQQGKSPDLSDPRLRPFYDDLERQQMGTPPAEEPHSALPDTMKPAISDAVLKQYMGGRDLSQITPADVAGNTGADPSLIGGYLDSMRAKVSGLPTRMDQTNAVKAIRDNGGVIEDDTSPTGYRASNGQFARGAQ